MAEGGARVAMHVFRRHRNGKDPRVSGVLVNKTRLCAGYLRTARALGVCPMLLAAAGAMAQPVLDTLRKPPPDSMSRAYGTRLAALVESRYPELLASKHTGIPVVTVLLNWDGTVAATNLEYAPLEYAANGDPPALTVSEEHFARFGHLAGQLRYMGAGRVQLANGPAVVIFGGRDAREVDRALVTRLFPKVLTQHAPVNDQLWIIFDHDGTVLRAGEEPVAPEKLRETLETRFPKMRTADVTTAPVFGSDDRPLEDAGHHALTLNCLWLTADSPPP
jgi:hypothetical protein